MVVFLLKWFFINKKAAALISATAQEFYSVI